MSDDKPLWPDVRSWFRAVFVRWVAATTSSSLEAVVGTYVALTGPGATVARIVAWFVFCSALAMGNFRAWQAEHHKRRGAEAERDGLDAERRAVPQLRLKFVPGEPPYQQSHKITDRGPYPRRYSRVGVMHDGPRQVEGVRVVLDLEPHPEGFPIKHALAVMGEPAGTGSCSVAPGTEPTRFFDVLLQPVSVLVVSTSDDPTPNEVVHATGPPSVRFAPGDVAMPEPVPRMRLIAEGRDARSAELRLEVTYTSDGRVVELRPV